MIGEDTETLPGVREVTYGEALIVSDLNDMFWKQKSTGWWWDLVVEPLGKNGVRYQLRVNDGSVLKAWVDINMNL